MCQSVENAYLYTNRAACDGCGRITENLEYHEDTDQALCKTCRPDTERNFIGIPEVMRQRKEYLLSVAHNQMTHGHQCLCAQCIVERIQFM